MFCRKYRYVNRKEVSSTHTPTHTRSDYHGWNTELKFTSQPLTPEDVGIRFSCCANITSEDVCTAGSCSNSCGPDVHCK